MLDIREVGLFFLNETQYGNSRDSYWSLLVEDVAAALSARQHPCVPFDVTSKDQLDFLAAVCNQGGFPRFIANFNFCPALTSPENMSKIGLLGNAPFPSLALFMDHPCHLAEPIGEMEALIEKQPELAPLRRYLIIEEEHRAFMHYLGVPDERIGVMAQGGPPPGEPRSRFVERNIPLVFAGTIIPLDADSAFHLRAGCSDPAHAAALDQAVHETLEGTRDIFEIVRDAFAGLLDGETAPDLADLVSCVDTRTRAIRRHSMLEPLKNLPIHFFGNIAPEFRRDRPLSIFHGPVTYRDLLNIFDRTKVVLNDSINLRSSALVRMYYPMARGCLIAGTADDFLTSAFQDGEEMLFLRPGKEGRDALRECLRDVARCETMAEAGKARYAAGHTWGHRIGPLIDILDGKA
jgi:hypothetical protein